MVTGIDMLLKGFMVGTQNISTSDEPTANILLLGKTGAGKSSFINYFLNDDVAETGAGEPVTQELFHYYKCDTGKFPILIYDTKGLEANTAEQQVNEIISEVKRANHSDNIFNWFHTIFYVVSMSTARFEDYEAQLIKDMSKSISQHIHIILTHCDSHENDVEEMRRTILSKIGDNDHVQIFPVVSVDIKKRNGTEFHKRGKEEIEKSVFDLLWSDICTKVSSDYAYEAHYSIRSIVREMFDDAIELLDETLRFGNLIKAAKDDSGVDELFDLRLDEYSERIEKKIDEINQRYNKVLAPARQMYESYRNVVADNYAEQNGLDFSFGDDFMAFNFDVDDMFEKIAPNMSKLDDEPDFKTIVSGIGDLLSLRKRTRKFLEEEKSKSLKKVPSQEEIQKEAYEKLMESV